MLKYLKEKCVVQKKILAENLIEKKNQNSDFSDEKPISFDYFLFTFYSRESAQHDRGSQQELTFVCLGNTKKKTGQSL